jgi:hypothetical protein
LHALLLLLPLVSLLPPLRLHVVLLLWPSTLPPMPSTSTSSTRSHALLLLVLLLAAPATPPRPVCHGPLLLLWPVTLGTNTRLVAVLRLFTFLLDQVVKAHVELLLC